MKDKSRKEKAFEEEIVNAITLIILAVNPILAEDRILLWEIHSSRLNWKFVA